MTGLPSLVAGLNVHCSDAFTASSSQLELRVERLSDFRILSDGPVGQHEHLGSDDTLNATGFRFRGVNGIDCPDCLRRKCRAVA